MGAQNLDLVTHPIDDGGDRGKIHAELAQQQNLLQPQQLVLLVVPVPVGADPGWTEQPDLVVVAQRPGGRTRHARYLLNRPAHRPRPPRRSPPRLKAAVTVRSNRTRLRRRQPAW